MKKIVIDSGGTTFKYKILDENYKEIAGGKFPNGNVTITFKGVLENIEKIKKLYGKIDSGIAAFAGLEGLEDGLRDLLSKNLSFVKKVMIISDAVMPVYAVSENCFALTLGTGSAIFSKVNNRIKQYLGYGYAIGDLGSGFEIGRKILLNSLNESNNTILDEIASLFNISSDIIKFLWKDKNKIQANIASISKLVNSENKYIKSYSTKIFKSVFDEYLNFVEKIIDRKSTIVLNGGIWNKIDLSIELLENRFSNKIVFIENDPIGIGVEILRDKKW